jgi:diadenosine tetraphosphate (Ap4A) HIT family hydrolase
MNPACELCSRPGGDLVWRDARWRVVRVSDAAFPAYYRVICNDHVAEFSDLLAPERQRCMNLVVAVERVLREQLAPTKVNLASLGNKTPHLHWHVIARFDWDSHFPQPVWGAAQRAPERDAAARLAVPLAELDRAVAAALA